MKISCNTDALLKQLQEFHKDAVKRMENMVEIFSYKIAWQAIENTPYGNSADYIKLYNAPSRLKYMQPLEGSAKGGWGIWMNKYSREMVPLRADSENATNTKSFAEHDSKQYKLGDTVYVVNSVPYVSTDGWSYSNYKNGDPVRSLESGASDQAPNGIMQPTLDSILGIYQLQLNEFYKAT